MNPDDYFLKQKKLGAKKLNQIRSRQPEPKPTVTQQSDGTKTVLKKEKGRVVVDRFGHFVTKYRG